ncbi:MAG: hypothetical protein IT365_25990 [Candidatus Hydrogenedentes bacterium]|nr:hypothetical protein [Candidatus Hydrogenedentota bacterium]
METTAKRQHLGALGTCFFTVFGFAPGVGTVWAGLTLYNFNAHEIAPSSYAMFVLQVFGFAVIMWPDILFAYFGQKAPARHLVLSFFFGGMGIGALTLIFVNWLFMPLLVCSWIVFACTGLAYLFAVGEYH